MPTTLDLGARDTLDLLDAVLAGHFGVACAVRGVELADFRQDVLLKLLALQHGRSPFDPTRARTNARAQLYGYMLMVARGVWSKRQERERYRAVRHAQLRHDPYAVAETAGAGHTPWLRPAAGVASGVH